MSAELAYAYLAPSEVLVARGRTDLRLATSGGNVEGRPAEHPRFFYGFVASPEQAAMALLTCARVARTRYYMPPGMVAATIRAADPVVTSNGDRLRFESFSACCGVYARLDVLPDGLDRPPTSAGTTNVDFNPPMREALARLSGDQPMRLEVGTEHVAVRTFGAEVTERKVPLPNRWVRGFAELQALAGGMQLVGEIPVADARKFVRSLPRTSRRMSWALPTGGTLRLTSQHQPGAVCLAGPERLRALEPMLRFATLMRAYGYPEQATPTASAWELVLSDSRFILILSPEVSRGFSGEGQLLFDLAASSARDDAALVEPLLGWTSLIEVGAFAKRASLSLERARQALAYLSAEGRVGFDLAENAYFHRELPFYGESLLAMHPRLLDARALVNEGRVTLSPRGAHVQSDDVVHRVTFSSEADSCTCPWWGKYSGERGPCKHVLAARLATQT